MENFNKNNPTQGWTEDKKYDFCKMENKWVKELPKSGKRKVGVAGAANDPTFSSVEEINFAFENDILRRKENWKYLCHICDYVTNLKGNLTQHLAVNGIGARFKCDKCEKDFSQKSSLKEHRKSHNASSNIKCSQCPFFPTSNVLQCCGHFVAQKPIIFRKIHVFIKKARNRRLKLGKQKYKSFLVYLTKFH